MFRVALCFRPSVSSVSTFLYFGTLTQCFWNTLCESLLVFFCYFFYYLDSNEGIAIFHAFCVSRERMRFPTKPPKSPEKDAYPLENISSTQTKSKWCFVHIFLSIFATFLIIVAFVFCFVFCGSLGLHQCFKTDLRIRFKYTPMSNTFPFFHFSFLYSHQHFPIRCTM